MNIQLEIEETRKRIYGLNIMKAQLFIATYWGMFLILFCKLFRREKSLSIMTKKVDEAKSIIKEVNQQIVRNEKLLVILLDW